jgi:hypothetical protein
VVNLRSKLILLAVPVALVVAAFGAWESGFYW